MFDLAADPGRIVPALEHDPMLAPLVRCHPGLRIPGAWDPFECAVRAVLGQQVSVAAGRTFAARLVERAGQPVSTGERELTHLFPSPVALACADLDGLGLTSARLGALRALAGAVRDGLDLNGPAEDVIGALAAMPGIGPWTAQYTALRALGEPDAFPAADLVLRRVASSTATPLSARALDACAEAWRPWRGYAVLHLWRAAADGGR
jgi:AraC family transcriptional regulator of adaptative response / DNA-3-methyladenine glycosylase II